MKPTLEEVLKPPFRHDGVAESGEVYVGVNKVHFSDTRIMQVRGWGFFQNFENGEQLQDEFKDFAVAALNEKWERDFGEPLRWENRFNGSCSCPGCQNFSHISTKYCPSCGRRLLPPKEE